MGTRSDRRETTSNPSPRPCTPAVRPSAAPTSNSNGSAGGALVTPSIEWKEAAACLWVEPRIRGCNQSGVFLFVHHHPKCGERVAEWREAALEQQERVIAGPHTASKVEHLVCPVLRPTTHEVEHQL